MAQCLKHTDAEHQAFLDHTADLIVGLAQALYPDDPVRMAACALAACGSVPPVYPGTLVSAESPGLSPAEVERRIAGERIPWKGNR
jgi:hypothetical protein